MFPYPSDSVGAMLKAVLLLSTFLAVGGEQCESDESQLLQHSTAKDEEIPGSRVTVNLFGVVESP